MRRMMVAFALLTACGGSEPAVTPTRPLSAAEHRTEAKRHDKEAQHHEAEARTAGRSTDSYRCGDTVLFDQSTSGTERLSARVPCWSVEVSGDHLREAQRERDEARRHRAAAYSLEEAERHYCSALSPDERDHTPFWHRSDIVAVTKVERSGRLRGARVVFRKVPSLTSDWMELAVKCHQARAAATGWDPTYMVYDPSVLEGVHVEVRDDPKGIAVEVTSGRDDTAAAIYGRAEGLLRPEAESKE